MDKKVDSKADRKELIGAIIDRAEDLLEKLTGSEETVIAGEDYDWLSGQITEILALHQEQPDPEVWYTETWVDQDIVDALEDQNIEATQERLEQVKERVIPLFDDKTERNEQIADVVWELFEPAEEVKRILNVTDEDIQMLQKN